MAARTYTRAQLEQLGKPIVSTRCGPIKDYLVEVLYPNAQSTDWLGKSYEMDEKGRMWERELVIDSTGEARVPGQSYPLGTQLRWQRIVQITPDQLMGRFAVHLKLHNMITIDVDGYTKDLNHAPKDEHGMLVFRFEDSTELYAVDGYVRERSFTIRPFSTSDLFDLLTKRDGASWSKLCGCAPITRSYTYITIDLQCVR